MFLPFYSQPSRLLGLSKIIMFNTFQSKKCHNFIGCLYGCEIWGLYLRETHTEVVCKRGAEGGMWAAERGDDNKLKKYMRSLTICIYPSTSNFLSG